MKQLTKTYLKTNYLYRNGTKEWKTEIALQINNKKCIANKRMFNKKNHHAYWFVIRFHNE